MAARSTSQSTYSFSTSAKTSGGSFLGGSNLGSSSLGSSSLGSSSLGRTSTPSKKDAKEPVIKNIDMDEDMKDRALATVKEAMEKFDSEKDRAAYIKKEFDIEFDTTWHVVVGKHFASFVTHESKCFIYFYIGPIAFLLWKSG